MIIRGGIKMRKLTANSLLDVMSDLFSEETSIAVTDKEKYIYYRPSKRIDLKIQKGDDIKKGTIAYKALHNKQKISEFIDRDLFGVPYHGVAVPYQNENKISGCVLAIYPVVNEGKSVVTVKTEDGWIPVPFEDIQFLKVKNRKTYVYTNEEMGEHKNSLQEFEHYLPVELFVRCHRSFIVNVKQIKEIYPDSNSTFVLLMNNDKSISVSQSYASYFRKLLNF